MEEPSVQSPTSPSTLRQLTTRYNGLSRTGSEDTAAIPYKIHVSSVYLARTKSKLELTRLPHEILLPGRRNSHPIAERDYSCRNDGVTHRDIEHLVDYWLEDYDWRSREEHLNQQLPQYRITLPESQGNDADKPSRTHFVHARSTSPDAIPLLYCHGGPGGILEAVKVVRSLTEPEGEGQPAFHLVVPSFPGCGFSDASPSALTGPTAIARMCDNLMRSLGYEHYIAHGIDWGFAVCRALAIHHTGSCLAIHTTTPLPTLKRPSLTFRPLQYIRYLLARCTRGRIPFLRFDYHPTDFMRPISVPCQRRWPADSRPRRYLGLGWSAGLGLRPDVFSYGLCDSPVGLLAWIYEGMMQRTQRADAFAEQDVLDFTMMAWLPGPEGALALDHLTSEPGDLVEAAERYSPTPLGISAFLDPSGLQPEPLAWAGCLQPLVWTKRHEILAAWPVWQQPLEVVRDLRSFAGLLQGRSGNET